MRACRHPNGKFLVFAFDDGRQAVVDCSRFFGFARLSLNLSGEEAIFRLSFAASELMTLAVARKAPLDVQAKAEREGFETIEHCFHWKRFTYAEAHFMECTAQAFFTRGSVQRAAIAAQRYCETLRAMGDSTLPDPDALLPELLEPSESIGA